MTAASPSPETTPEVRIARLERRLERESRARLEAEAIAEAGTRELYDQTRRLGLLETVATESNRASSVEDVLASTLKLICEFVQWPLGHVYIRDQAQPVPALKSTRVWFEAGDIESGAFRDASESLVFGEGDGLPGRVMAWGTSVWLSDLSEDRNFPRIALARDCGLRAAFAFPVMVGTEVAAVFEFFIDRETPPDEPLLRLLDQIGAVLGRAIERDRALRLSERTNAELKRIAAEAQAASAAKTNFLAVTSHEVRTPLNAILGLAEALARAPMPQDQRELVDGIRNSGSMLLRLLNAVLDFARMDSGQVALAEAPFDVEAMAAAVGQLWRLRGHETGVSVELDLSALARPCWIIGDAGKVEQTLVNLIANAVKFTPVGGKVTVRLSSHDEPGRRSILAEVADDGPGVSDADRERIFQAYEQTEQGREAGGAGLGLAICTGNVRAMGGRIGVMPRPEGGSRFWFEFEADAALAPEAAMDAAEVPIPDEDGERPIRVLAAEDNAANRQVLKLLLQPVGVDPVFAEDGQAAVEAAMAGAYDLILMDAQMPRMDGVTALKEIRSGAGPCADIPVHMVTANVFDDDIARYREAGADGVIAKPIVVAELYAVLQAVAMGGGRAAAA